MKDIDLEPLRAAIRKYKMMELWGDSFRDITAQERKTRANKKALEARDIYMRLMISGRKKRWSMFRDQVNDFFGSNVERMTAAEIENTCQLFYQSWAVKKALGLRTSTRHTAQAIGGKHWQAWGKTDSGQVC